MTAPLKKHVQKQYRDVQLNPQQLQTLQQLGKENTAPPRRHHSLYSLVAGIALLGLGSVFWYRSTLLPQLPPQAIQSASTTDEATRLARAIAVEVTKNHIKLKPLEVQSNQFAQVKNYFTELDFSPVISGQFSTDQHQLLGARYCSIQGSTAAQIRYQHANGQVETLYETAYDPALFAALPSIEQGEAPIELMEKGLRVQIWLEKGLVFAAVTELETQ